MTAKLRDVMHAFLVGRLGCEEIDALELTPEQKSARKADYFHSDRHIVIELKSLEDDRTRLIGGLLAKWSKDPAWRGFQGTLSIQDVLRSQPRGHDLNIELSDRVLSVVRTACLKANKQIGATAATFGLHDPMGVLVLLNDEVDVLTPGVISSALVPMIRPGGGVRPTRCPHIDTVILVSWAHQIVDGSPKGTQFTAVVPADELDEDQARDSFETHFLREWSAFQGKPFTYGGAIKSPEVFERYEFTGRKEPVVIDLDRFTAEGELGRNTPDSCEPGRSSGGT